MVALVGDNGAGKSTLIKLISGIYPADEGTILWEGGPVSIRSPHDATALGIATVYQDLALCDNLDVVANLFLGRELARPSGPLGVMDEVAMETQAVAVLRRLSVKIPNVRIPIASLSGGQRQSVAVARSVMGKNRVVFLDEPTAALGVAQTKEVLELVKRLREEGHGVVLISHNLADVFEVADRITRPPARALGRHLRRAQGGPRAAGGADDRRGARAGRRRGSDRRSAASMSSTQEHDPRVIREQAGLGGFVADYRRRLAQGDIGQLPVLVGLIAIGAIFQVASNGVFLGSFNLVNLTLQMAAVGTISVGVVLVLLLGEIDLTAGIVSGLCAAVMAVLNVNMGQSAAVALLAGTLTGAAVGLLQGFWITRFGIPSFVVTLAGLIGWQGLLLYVLGPTGTVNLKDPLDHRPRRHVLPRAARLRAGRAVPGLRRGRADPGVPQAPGGGAERPADRIRGDPRGAGERRRPDRGGHARLRPRRRLRPGVLRRAGRRDGLPAPADPLRADDLRDRRQRRGRPPGRDPGAARADARVRDRVDARRLGRHPGRVARPGRQSDRPARATCS